MIIEKKKKHSFVERIMLALNVVTLVALIASYLGGVISPERFWPLAFVAMAYPLILGGIGLFTIYWLLRRKWFIFLNIAFVLIKWDNVSSTVQFPQEKKEELGTAPTTVMTFNVRQFNRFKWVENENIVPQMYDLFFAQKPDIICLQEIYQDDSGRFPKIDTLLKLFPAGQIHLERYRPNRSGKWKHKPKGYSGTVTLSRYPIVNKGRVYFNSNHGNMGIFTDVVIENDTIRVYNIHLQSIGLKSEEYAVIDKLIEDQQLDDLAKGEHLLQQMVDGFEQRSFQAELVAEHIQSCAHSVIVCGDFNDVPTSYTYKTVCKGLEDSFSESGSGFGNTYVRVPFFRIDNILHSPGFKSTSHHVYDDKILSDHYPLVATFSLKN